MCLNTKAEFLFIASFLELLFSSFALSFYWVAETNTQHKKGQSGEGTITHSANSNRLNIHILYNTSTFCSCYDSDVVSLQDFIIYNINCYLSTL